MTPKFHILLIFLIQLFEMTAVSSQLTRRKRGDDVDPLNVVVDNLSQQLTSLTAEVNALKTKTAALETSVAFYVWHNSNPIRAGPHATLIMNHVATNVGNGYDALTGVFTVPVSGLYDFQASFMTFTSNTVTKVYAAIYVDSRQMAEGVADSGHNYWDQSTIRAVLQLTAGQKVYVRNVLNTEAEYYSSAGQPYTTFSGFLVTPAVH